MPTPKKKQTKGEVGREGILNAAASLFRQHGYSGVSLRTIAQAAGIKAGSIYYHFESKDAIVIDILNIGILKVHDEVRVCIAAVPANAPASVVLRAALRGYLSALLEHGDYASANVRIFGQVPPLVREANLIARQNYEKYIDDLLLNLQQQGRIREEIDISHLRLLLIGALNATLEWFDPSKGSTEKLADDYADVFLKGLLTQAEAKP